jgi:hypothetical protein
MKAFALTLVSLTFLGCPWDAGTHNPVSDSYPCGTRAHVCAVHPLACCWNGSECGAAGLSCPEGMCCATGDTFGVADAGKAPQPQFAP